MDAVVIAGGTPLPEEPLYPYTQGKPKALVDVAGKPMIQWVLDALCGAGNIERVAIVGLPDADGLICHKMVASLADQGGILQNIRFGVTELLRTQANVGHVAIVSADIPAILPRHVEWVVGEAMQTDLDVYYNVIERQTMETRYPGSKRSYVRLKDAEVCGGDLNIVRAATVLHNEAIWDRIVAARKNALKQAALMGYDTLLLLLLRLISVDGAVKRVTRRLNLTGQALVCPFAEIGMDVDKPHQLELMRADLSRQQPDNPRAAQSVAR